MIKRLYNSARDSVRSVLFLASLMIPTKVENEGLLERIEGIEETQDTLTTAVLGLSGGLNQVNDELDETREDVGYVQDMVEELTPKKEPKRRKVFHYDPNKDYKNKEINHLNLAD